MIKPIRQKRPTVGSSKTLLLHNVSAHKVKVTVTFLKEKNIQVLALQSRFSSMSLLVAPPRQRKVGWADIFPHSGPGKNSQFSECIVSGHPTVKMFLNLGADDWNCMCEAEESPVKECECCGQSDRYFLFYCPADITRRS